jgi:hypothetical protein
MKTININNNKCSIDFQKCVQADKQPQFDITSEEWNKAFRADEPGLYYLKGFMKIEDQQLAQRMLRSFMKQFKHHSHHKTIIDRVELEYIWGGSYSSFKLPKNVWVQDSVESCEKLPYESTRSMDVEFSKISLLKLPVADLDPGHLQGYDWVILSVKNPMNQETFSQAHKILRYCNSKDIQIPVWCFDKQVRFDVLKSEPLNLHDNTLGKDGLYFDLPKRGSQLVDNNETIAREVQVIDNSINNARVKSMAAELEAGYGLYGLDMLARTNGKTMFWNQNFGVKNRSEYCTKVLGIPNNLASQYITAIRNIEILKPGMLERIFISGDDSTDILPHGYTRYRDLTPYLQAMQKLKEHPRYVDIEGMILNPKLSSRQLFKELPMKITTIAGEILIDPEVQDEAQLEPEAANVVMEEPLNVIDYIEEFRTTLSELVPGESILKFDNYVDGILELLIPKPSNWLNEGRTEDEIGEMLDEARADLYQSEYAQSY